jgi:alkanesulfonate monooxygenase SsuD/methylene tetrahydromethanopterin reductase-like flavin-dependent oxidoreductase (luciferase family)
VSPTADTVSAVDAMLGPMTDLGVVFLPQLPPERLRAVAHAAEQAGLRELWLWEDCFREGGVATIAVALAWTEQLRIGIGILPVPLRNVALTAMEISSLARMFPGRVEVGVGHGVQEWMGQVGARASSPLTLFREYVMALRRLLAGETVTVRGRYVQLTDVTLDWPPSPSPRLLGGALGPKTFALCGELTDGTIVTGGTSPAETRDALAIVDRARAEAGRSGEPHHVVVYLLAATGTGAERRMTAQLARSAVGAVDDVAAVGDAEQIAAMVRRYRALGTHTVVLQPTDDEPDVEGFVAFVAGEVQPLVNDD